MPRKKSRVLIISHTSAAPVNRMKFSHMAKDERFDLLLVTPQKWQNNITIADNSNNRGVAEYRTEFVKVCFDRHPVTYVIPTLPKIIRAYQPHLIYCEQEPICLASLQAAFLAGQVPVIYFTWENIDRKDIRYLMLWPIRKMCLQKSSFMVAGSKDAASVIRSHGYKKDIYITPILGVAEELFVPKCDSALRSDITSSPYVIGYVGRFVDQKDVTTLIQAVSRLKHSLDWHLVLVGNGPELELYRALFKKMEISERVTILTAVAHHEVPRIMNCFDVLVLPSKTTKKWKEQFGHVLIEAMACGVPVIGSSSGEIPSVIADAGLVFNEGNSADLMEKLNILADDAALRRSLIEKGLQRVRDRYADSQVAANMIALFEIVLKMEKITRNTLEVV